MIGPCTNTDDFHNGDGAKLAPAVKATLAQKHLEIRTHDQTVPTWFECLT